MNIEDIAEYLDDDALVIEGFDDCLLGYSQNGILIYSYRKMLEHFCQKYDMTAEQASEFIDHNIMPLQSEGDFIMCYGF